MGGREGGRDEGGKEGGVLEVGGRDERKGSQEQIGASIEVAWEAAVDYGRTDGGCREGGRGERREGGM